MSIPGAASPLFIGAAAGAAAAYQIDRSLRFNSGDTPFLNRTSSSTGNRKTWTWSGWVKFANIDKNDQTLFSAVSGSSYSQFRFLGSDSTASRSYKLNYQMYDGSTNTDVYTERIIRDPGAFYHIVLSIDFTQSAANDRVKIYVNNELTTNVSISGGSPTIASQNTDTFANLSGAVNNIGRHPTYAEYFDGYLADVHLIDGQALAPTDFGEYDDNNNWNPKAYAGTYGTNGFHLDFSDNSSNAALGTDSSGNSNTWTVNNLTAAALVANKGFDVVTWSGNGGSQSISSLAFQPDLVWIKRRDGSAWHFLFDSIRGANKAVFSNDGSAESNYGSGYLNSFDSNGFTLGSNADINGSSRTFVGWAWKAGGAASSNTDGTITASVSANTTYGFSIASYTGNGTSGATIGHGLSSAPGWIMVKRRNSSAFWEVFHTSLGNTKVLYLNNADAETSSSASWNNTSPTSSVFSVGNSSGTNASGSTYIAYCWSEVAGFSKFGTWQNNNSNTGTYVELGFRPRFILLKNSDNVEQWYILDSERKPTNVSPPDTTKLQPNTDAAEGSLAAHTATIDFLDSGFQIKSTNPNQGEISFQTRNYIYAAFAENPDQSVIDSLIDTPTNYTVDSGNPGGNYATLNPLVVDQKGTLSNGNLELTGGTSTWHGFSTIGVSSGKWYVEVTGLAGGGSANYEAGISDITQLNGSQVFDYFSRGYGYRNDAEKINNNSATSYGATYTSGDVIGIAADLDNGTLTFYKNGASQGTAFTGIPSGYTYHFAHFSRTSSDKVAWNFGQRPFAYTPPTGYLSLCTANLPDPTIADGSTAFDIALWAGTGSSNAITGLNTAPDLAWIKSRNSTGHHTLVDAVRGPTKALFSNRTVGEVTDAGYLSSFDSNGFTVVSDNDVNGSGYNYVAWAWDGGTSTVSNTDGSITSSVRANASAGFSIVTATLPNYYTNYTIGHGLNATPHFIIGKNRAESNQWDVYHQDVGTGKLLRLNSTNAVSNATSNQDSYYPTAPTNSVFGFVGNNNTMNFVWYVFTEVEGYSAFGSYTGNGSDDGPFVFTGFRVAWLLIKNTSTNGETWTIYDSTRDVDNAAKQRLLPNSSDAESVGSSARFKDLLSNGFKIRGTSGEQNTSGDVYIYAAFAEHPFKTARAR